MPDSHSLASLEADIASAADRAAGLERLARFLPQAGRRYAERRNHDWGPERRDNVSMLSPWVRHRLITEAELCQAVLSRHSVGASRKFIEEVFWRTYYKGWLEQHPDAWRRYCLERDAVLDSAERDPALARDLAAATSGRTGIAAFDSWSQELVTTGYLHNHARMWFASIWMFTLRLPWVLGADFFLRHLLDGDQASNTLSWRWVAGLHTRGRAYQATPQNIAAYTGDRFPHADGLAQQIEPLDDAPIPTVPLRQPRVPDDAAPSLLVLHDDDCAGDGFDPGGRVVAVAGLTDACRRSPLGVAGPAREFAAAAVREGTRLAAERLEVEDLGVVPGEALAEHARALGVHQIVLPRLPVGPSAAHVDLLRPQLEAAGLVVAERLRAWDSACWPEAGSGYFAFKPVIPRVLAAEGISEAVDGGQARRQR